MADTQSLTVTLYVQAQRALDDPFSLTSALIVVVFFLVSSSAIQSYNKRQRLIPGVPIVGIDERGSVKAARKRFVHDAKGLLQEGYEMAGGGLFYVPSPLGERLMLSREYAEELKSAPIDKVDFVATFQEVYDLMPAIEEEIQDSFEAIWPKCDGSTTQGILKCLDTNVLRLDRSRRRREIHPTGR
ncbi:MAG: hypothetical protein Q9228_006770 [Teloschistes exilis]